VPETALITKTECLPDGCVKADTSLGASFFARAEYLEGTGVPVPSAGDEISGGAAEKLLAASRAYLAERAALLCLNRSEHSRLLLTRKLLKKNFCLDACGMALDFLEARALLSDARYARAWLSERVLKGVEGRARLEAELARRGIARETARDALDEFFAAHDEDAACRAALRAALGKGKSPEYAARHLLRKGFSPRLIRRALEAATLGPGSAQRDCREG